MTPNRTLDDRDHEIIASRKEGLSVPRIADRLGATLTSVQARITKLVRHGYLAPQRNVAIFTPEMDEELIRLRLAKQSFAKIAPVLGVTAKQAANRVEALRREGRMPRDGLRNAGQKYDWDVLDPQVRRMLEGAQNAEQISRVLGISSMTLRNRIYAKHHDIATRSRDGMQFPNEDSVLDLGRKHALPAGHPVTLACIGMTTDQFRSAAR